MEGGKREKTGDICNTVNNKQWGWHTKEKRNRAWPLNSTTVLEHCCCESITVGLRYPAAGAPSQRGSSGLCCFVMLSWGTKFLVHQLQLGKLNLLGNCSSAKTYMDKSPAPDPRMVRKDHSDWSELCSCDWMGKASVLLVAIEFLKLLYVWHREQKHSADRRFSTEASPLS